MNRVLSSVRSWLGPLTLITLAVVLAIIFGRLRERAEPAPPTFQSSLPGPSPTIESPLPTMPPVQTRRYSTPTPLPNQGVWVGPASEVTLTGEDITIEALSNLDLDDDTLVSRASVRGGGITIVTVDLRTGQVQRLSQVAERGIEGPRISGRHVAWAEYPVQMNDVGQLHVFDLMQTREFTVEQGLIHWPDLKDSLLVWQESHASGIGIYGYDLATNQAIAIAVGPAIYSFPRVCSRQWVIYLKQGLQEHWPSIVDLHAYNLLTGEDILIGQVLFPRSASVGQQHACDGQRVAWLGARATGATLTFEQHLYDLATRTDRILNLPNPGAAYHVLIEGDFLISVVGYDLQRDIPFNVLWGLPPDQITGGQLVLSNNRLAWTAQPYGGSQHLYTAFIIRQP